MEPKVDDEFEQPVPEETGEPQVFAVSKDDQRGSRFTRRHFIEIAAASAAALAVGGKIALGNAGEFPVTNPGMGEIYLYSGPATSYSVLQPLSEGELVRLIGRNSDHSWIQVETQAGNTGWVSHDVLDFSNPVYQDPQAYQPATPAATQETEQIILNPQLAVLQAVHFVDANNGWAVGDSGTILRIRKDGQYSYQAQNSLVSNHLKDVFFISANQGWAVGASGRILYTSNGGTTWTPQTSPVSSTLNCVFFLNALEGWIGTLGGVLKTVNGGANWTQVVSGYPVDIVSLQFLDSNNGVFVAKSTTEADSVGYSTDGGATWYYAGKEIYFENLNDLHFPSASFGAVVGSWSSGPDIYTSTDGGQYWAYYWESLTAGELKAVHFADNSRGWATDGTRVIRTIDAGVVWVVANNTNGGNDLHFVSTLLGFLVGAAGIKVTLDGGVTWLAVTSDPQAPQQTIVYLPIIRKDRTPTPTPTPRPTYTPSPTPCTCDAMCSCDNYCSCDDVCTCDLVCTCDSIHYWYPN